MGMTGQKRTTERMCCACGTRREKKDLIRIVRTPEGKVTADGTGRANGRGVYLCRDAACIRLAEKKKAAERSLKTEVPAEVYGELESLL